MHEGPVPGRAIVTRRAIVDIVRTAVQGSYGVTGLSDPDLASRLLRWLGLRTSGIRLGLEGDLDLDLYLTVAYGVPVAEVARQVDSAVRYALRRSIARDVRRLTVHVGGLHYQPVAAPPGTSATLPSAAPVTDIPAEPEAVLEHDGRAPGRLGRRTATLGGAAAVDAAAGAAIEAHGAPGDGPA
ncbi:MAG TPA: Asp23/Gls24 family envelope stress response protein [Candidatus Limnocylindrales bacterium]